ncbi:aminodeoxychorismate synthase component I [Sphingomonas sp.]|uniref:aminodeoxychorismate synthase component I n=1 Tax=Sphingomonas sp. TaxID=28214 RepID=UPI001DE3C29C|nr:aminodeoxychorismate synthase component I [Sphingomonas sp.]MBX9795981.1 aminodeoxychorismate synthase component I [Sphingomonas sp.]
MAPHPPFVLLDDARDGGATPRLYQHPVAVVEAREVADVAPALARVRAGVRAGQYAAGFLAYEAAAAFEPALAPPPPGTMPLLWFGLFEGFSTPDLAELPPADGALAGMPQPQITRGAYDARLDQLIALIRAGDLYQANLTYFADVPVAGAPLALYARLRAARAGYGAVIATGAQHIISLSPEEFFTLAGDTLSCRPMKGTARRLADPAADAEAARALAADPKQRAENLMIVDLMRNDLARIAVAGSVAVPALFSVESYPTVHQMVSTVTARIRPGLDWADALAALFPCGSITGAPKIRAIEALAQIEGRARGVYTGAIGRIDPGGDAVFSVAIRTLTLADGAPVAELGLGSGIVADSTAPAEWDETLAKAAFVRPAPPRFDLIETMAFDPAHGIALIELHLARMKASARALGFAFDRHAARNELQAATFRLDRASRVRLLLSPSGAIAVETRAAPPAPSAPMAVALRPHPLPGADLRRHHKTSDRRFWAEARDPGADETLFVDADGMLTEGSFTSLFVPRGDRLLTPPLARAILPGVLRETLIAQGRAVEAELRPEDLAGDFLIGNALRGLMPARLRSAADGDSARPTAMGGQR